MYNTNIIKIYQIVNSFLKYFLFLLKITISHQKGDFLHYFHYFKEHLKPKNLS